MKKIAIVLTQPIEYGTSSMIRCRNIINEYPKRGWEVICFSPYPDRNSQYYDEHINMDSHIKLKRYGGIYDAGRTSNEKKTLKKKLLSFMRRMYKKIDLFGSSIKYVKYKKEICKDIKKENCFFLFSFSDPKTAHMVAGYCKKNIKNIEYIQQWGDPLTLDITGKSIWPRWFKHIVEARLLKPADRVCYVSPLTFKEQKKEFKKESRKMIFLPTPCERKEYESNNNKRIRIGYFGSYNIVARDIRPFYVAACNIKECDFIFVGDSDVKIEYKENIKIVNRVTPEELEEYISKVDILVCLMNKRGTQIPGKIYHYGGTNKEVLVIKDGECGDEIEKFFTKYDRYTFVENNKDAIIEAIYNYISNGVPRRTPLNEFRAEIVATALIDGLV